MRRQSVEALMAAMLEQLDANDLGQRIALIRLFQRAIKQSRFGNGLRRYLRIDAATTEKHEPTHTVPPRRVDGVNSYQDVVTQEAAIVGGVGRDAADTSGTK